MTPRKQWVVGFVFRNKSEIALISKNHPKWQAGKLNGIGGKINPEEAPLSAMHREFLEEAGAELNDWREFALLKVQDGDLYCFVAHGDYPVRSMTDEKISWYKISDLERLPVISNLLWLVPLALDDDAKHTVTDYYQSASREV